MSSTLTILSAAVTRRLGRPTTDALLTSSDITGALNDAANAFSVVYPWPWLETSENISTTTGTDTYTVGTAASYVATVSLRIAGNPPLTRMSKAELDRQYPSTQSGSPVAFATVGISSLVVRPVPITTVLPTLVHLYHRAETALASGSDVLLCPIWFEQAIVERAAGEMFFRAGNTQMGNIALQRYEDIRNYTLERVRRDQALSDGNGMVPNQPLAPLPGAKEAAS